MIWKRLFAYQDLRHAFRALSRAPSFTAVGTITLAIGLGATTALFSIVNGVLLQPLSYPQSDRLYLARTAPPPQAKMNRDFPVNALHFHNWRRSCTLCEQVSLAQFLYLTLTGNGEPVRLPALSISYNFFATLGIQPSLGRGFLPTEEAPGSWDKVILTDFIWRTRFASDPAIIGRAIQINGEPHTVVGVMPPTLHLPRGDQWGGFFGPADVPAIFRPLNFDPARAAPIGNLNYSSIIRLKPGIQPEHAAAQLNLLLSEFKVQTTTVLLSLQQQVTRSVRGPLLLLFCTVAAVLLLVCANIGNLMLVRTIGRSKEAGVRLALGASRASLVSLVLLEALLLVSFGGLVGLVFANVGLELFTTNAPSSLPRLEEIQMDWRVFSFAGLAAAFCTAACGLFPALQLSRVEPLQTLKAASSNSTQTIQKFRVREMIVGFEVALSTMLLIIGALLTVSFLRVMKSEKGFEAVHVVTQDVSFLNPKYARGGRRRFVDETLAKFAAIPSIRSAAVINQLPLKGEDWVSDLADPKQPARAIEQSALANFRFVSPEYWNAMGISLKKGRFLQESDKGRPNAVISERAAQHLWPGENPLGKHVKGAGPNAPSLEVVGVVAEVRAFADREASMIVYEHYYRMQPIAMSFVLRVASDPVAAANAVRSILSSADPEMALSPARTMHQILAESVATRKYEAYLAGAFAISALLLASIGIFGVISFTVARRTPEMGIRIALGARAGQLTAMIIRQGMIPVVAGLIAGLAGAAVLSRFIVSQLYLVTPNDPAIIITIALTLSAVGTLACWIPARRINRIDPIVALRFE